MYRSEVISVLYEQNFISFYINTLGPFSRALSQIVLQYIYAFTIIISMMPIIEQSVKMQKITYSITTEMHS